MKRRLIEVLRRHPVLGSGSLIAALVVALVLLFQGVGWARWGVFVSRVEAASARPASNVTRVASWSFAFRDRAVTLRVPINMRELDLARRVDTRSMFGATGSLRAHYVSRVIGAQSHSRFIDTLAGRLRAIQSARRLDQDEYLELMALAVQSLRYGSGNGRVRLPIETVASGSGVCSEKSLLLAALMVHEGYQTGLWVFDSQNHVALGVGSDSARFGETGYAFIETTRSAFVGEYDTQFLASGPFSRPPQFIPLANGRCYGAGSEVEYILRELTAAKRQRDALGSSCLFGVAEGQGHVACPSLTTRKQAARDLVSYIRGQTDDREALFERLLRATATAAAEGPPALLR